MPRAEPAKTQIIGPNLGPVAYAPRMCGCIVFLAAALSPRLAIFLLWLFDNDRMSAAFNSFWVPLIGFFFLPWTTLAWAVAYAPVGGVTGFGWFIVILGFVADITTFTSGARARGDRSSYA
jgi:hypothetical protein